MERSRGREERVRLYKRASSAIIETAGSRKIVLTYFLFSPVIRRRSASKETFSIAAVFIHVPVTKEVLLFEKCRIRDFLLRLARACPIYHQN